MKQLWAVFFLVTALMTANFAVAEADLNVSSPQIAIIKSSIQARHAKLSVFYQQGTVGLTQDGLVAIKDAGSVPLKDRGAVNALVQAENADRVKLYAEIASANGHPEWQGQIQQTFANRWISKAQRGWFYQQGGNWVKK